MTIVALVFRMIVNFGLAQYLYVTWVWNYRPGLSAIGEEKYREEEQNEREYERDQDQDEGQQSQKEIQSKKNGVWIYSMMHFLFYTGSYRLLPSVHFAPEIAVAYSIELFLGILPIMFI